MPSIRSRLFCDGVTETVVPGQTRTSPPRGNCKIAVSEPAVTEEPAPRRFPARTTVPDPLVTGTTVGVAVIARLATVGGWNGDFLPAVSSSAGWRRTIRRLPAASHV